MSAPAKIPAFEINADAVVAAQRAQTPELPPAAQLPAVVPAAPARPRFWERLSASAEGEAARLWLSYARRAAGSFMPAAGYVVPAAAMLGSAYVFAHLPGVSSEVAAAGVVAALGGSVIQGVFQADDGGSNIASYRKTGHRYPRLASFRDVMFYFAGPGIAATQVVAHLVDPPIGLAAGSALALLTGAFTYTAKGIRQARVS